MLYFNNHGKMFKIKADLPASTPPTAALAAPVAVDLGILTNINNDHAISPDGKTLGISDQSQGNRQSAVWVVPIEGAGTGSAAPNVSPKTRPPISTAGRPTARRSLSAANAITSLISTPSASTAAPKNA